MSKRQNYKPSSQNLSSHRNDGRIVALLGPTNTGKTHYAVDRMLSYASGMIGFPLRLLAREVYDKIVAFKGKSRVALITGEEKIIPDNAAYYVCTTESMPMSKPFEFIGIDEVQMATDWQRGHVFTDRILHARGRYETMFMGSDTIRHLIKSLIPEIEVMERPRFSRLSYVAPKNITHLPRRTAIVAFRAEDVYGMAELLRRQKGGAAIVMGSLSPRTRNAQVEMYQKGEVDYLVATDAIGMGLNMDIDHVAFATTRKFDGMKFRDLTAAELAQIAGRAGRYQTDGTFSTVKDGDGDMLTGQMVERLENHNFPPIKALMWRNNNLKYNSVQGLIKSLEVAPTTDGLTLGPEALDMYVLRKMAENDEVLKQASTPEKVRLLWEVCQIPDFRRLSPEHHVGLINRIYGFLAADFGLIPHDWMAKQVSRLDNCQGDIDTLASRIASVRIFTYISHRNGWLKDHAHWAHVTRGVEDKLSDALHDRLTQRFVDRRTAELLKELRKKGNLLVSIENQDSVYVEGHLMGHMEGFSFIAEKGASRDDHKSLKAAADKALREEVSKRANEFIAAEDGQITLDTSKGLGNPRLLWRGAPVANLIKGTHAFQPRAKLLASSLLVDEDAEKVTTRLDKWFQSHMAEEIGSLFQLNEELNGNVTLEEDQVALEGLARGIAFQLVEHYGVLPRDVVANDLRQVELEQRRGLHRYRVRIGSINLYIQQLLKPAATKLRLSMWALWNDITNLPEIPTPGMVWVDMDRRAPEEFYQIAGFTPAGKKAVRVDMVERLADAVRPLGAKENTDEKGFFETTPEIMGLVGLSGDDYANVMRAIGYYCQKRMVDYEIVAKQRKEAEEKILAEKAVKEAAKAKIKASKEGVNPNAAKEEKAEEKPAEEKPVEEVKAEDAKAEETPAAEKPADEKAETEEKPEKVEVLFFKWSGKKVSDNRPRHNNRPQGAKDNAPSDKPKGGKPHGKSQGKHNGPKRGKGKPQRDKGPKTHSFQIKKDDSSADADSPFAALMGLKETMGKDDKKGKGDKKSKSKK